MGEQAHGHVQDIAGSTTTESVVHEHRMNIGFKVWKTVNMNCFSAKLFKGKIKELFYLHVSVLRWDFHG